MWAHPGFQYQEGILTYLYIYIYIYIYAATKEVERYLKPIQLQLSGILKIRGSKKKSVITKDI